MVGAPTYGRIEFYLLHSRSRLRRLRHPVTIPRARQQLQRNVGADFAFVCWGPAAPSPVKTKPFPALRAQPAVSPPFRASLVRGG